MIKADFLRYIIVDTTGTPKDAFRHKRVATELPPAARKGYMKGWAVRSTNSNGIFFGPLTFGTDSCINTIMWETWKEAQTVRDRALSEDRYKVRQVSISLDHGEVAGAVATMERRARG